MRSEADIGQASLVNLGYGCTPQFDVDETKTARFCQAVFSFHKPGLLFAVAEAARPPSGAAGLGVGCSFGSGLGRGGRRRWLRLAATN
jgi:hypothetical protein